MNLRPHYMLNLAPFYIQEITYMRMPAEWEPQLATILTWAHSQTDFADNLYALEAFYLQLVSIISQEQEVWINASDESVNWLSDFYQQQPNVHVLPINSNDIWARDHGPINLYIQKKLTLQNFTFNGWGNKYPHALDNQINANMQQQPQLGAIDMHNHSLVLEGGSIETDGHHTLLTTKACLLNPNRNPHLSQQQIEHTLQHSLGFKRILWLENGQLQGDDTDAHIDTLVRFINPQTLMYCQAAKNDEHHHSLTKLQAELSTLTQANGEPYKLIALPLPSAIYNAQGQRLPASYANFLFINQRVLVPIYEVPEDKQALSLFQQALPNYKIEAINCRAAIEQFGALHCLSMQVHSLNSPL